VERSGRLAIARAADEGKDQSYFLWGLSQEQIARAMFPLGALSKGEVRDIAREAGLPMADKQDSQDFYSGDSNELLDTKDRPGDIVATDGKKLGTHRGYWHYTVGQRQGLGIGGGTPFYVVRIEPCRNEVVVGRREDAVAGSLVVCDLNWQGIAETAEPVTGFVKIRSTGRPIGPVTLENGVLSASCDLFGVAPGQSAVIYGDDGTILCGGVIDGLAQSQASS
jgi:tRNA-specific 2-thiouridylase